MTVPSIPYGKVINRNIQIYRDIDNIYSESGLISVLILSCGNHKVFKNSFSTTINSLKNYHGDLEYLLLEQGWDKDPRGAYDNVKFFNEITSDIDRSLVILPNRNGGINYGINQLWQLARGEYILFLENDWLCGHSNERWLELAKNIMDNHNDIGILQVRAIGDPNENWGLGKPEFSPWSCNGRPDVQERKAVFDGLDVIFYVAQKRIYGINNNPALWRKKMRDELGPMLEPELWSDLCHGETEYQERFIKTKWNAAHIHIPIYYHYPLRLRG